MAAANPTIPLFPLTEKRCGKCREVKPVSAFHRASRESSGYQQWCKDCRRGHNREERLQYFRDSYHNNKDKYLDSFYRRRYGITLARYREMYAEQDGLCFLCRSKCPTGRNLAVDHDHKTGAARRLLCGECNKALGSFKENTEVMRKAIDYLEAYKAGRM